MSPQGTGSAEAEEVGKSAAERYRTVDVARILGVSPSSVRRMVHAGHCEPGRHGRAYRFAFQDLVLLRTARGLAKNIPPQRVHRALRELKKQLPEARPMSGVRIYTEGGQVVVRDRDTVWQPESGQQVFHFAEPEAPPVAKVVETKNRVKREDTQSAKDWFDYALLIEQEDPDGARRAYERALEIDASMTDAYTNLGRLVHEGGDPRGAAKFYSEALQRSPDDSLAHYNFAIACEDVDDLEQARSSYQRSLEINPNFADAHYNLGRVLERLGARDEALKHLLAYRRLNDA